MSHVLEYTASSCYHITMAKAKLSTPVTILRPAENRCTFLHESILCLKMFSTLTLTISTAGASFLMHLLLHRECILDGPQERLGNSKDFTNTFPCDCNHLGWTLMKHLSTSAGFCSSVSGWLSEVYWDTLRYIRWILITTKWKHMKTKYRLSTKCLPGSFCFFRRSLHLFDSQASWVKTAIRFAQPSWLRGKLGWRFRTWRSSTKLDGWSTKLKQMKNK